MGPGSILDPSCHRGVKRIRDVASEESDGMSSAGTQRPCGLTPAIAERTGSLTHTVLGSRCDTVPSIDNI